MRVEGFGGDAEQAAGDLALVDRHERRAADDAAADVGAAAAVDQQDVGPELLVDVAVALGRERRAGRAEDADRAEVVLAPGLQAGLAAGHQEGRADAHERRARLLGEPPLPARVGPGRVAVEHDDRRAHQQAVDERVPHHPGRRREPQQAAAGLEIPAQRVRLEVLQQDAAVPVHDRLRDARRAGREEHRERMVEGDGQERERRRAPTAARPRRRVSGSSRPP